MNVLAEDRFQDLRMTRRTRTFVDVSDADVINQIANEHGLSPEVNVTGPTYKVLAQINQSDLAFLRERARAIDAELWMEGSTLNAQSRANRNGGTLQMTYGNELREFSVLADLAGQRTSVTVSGWDVSSKSELKYEATDAIISGELNGDTSGEAFSPPRLGRAKKRSCIPCRSAARRRRPKRRPFSKSVRGASSSVAAWRKRIAGSASAAMSICKGWGRCSTANITCQKSGISSMA